MKAVSVFDIFHMSVICSAYEAIQVGGDSLIVSLLSPNSLLNLKTHWQRSHLAGTVYLSVSFQSCGYNEEGQGKE